MEYKVASKIDQPWFGETCRRLNIEPGNIHITHTVQNPLSVCSFIRLEENERQYSIVLKQPTSGALANSPKHFGKLESKYYRKYESLSEKLDVSPLALFSEYDDDGHYTIVLNDGRNGRTTIERDVILTRTQCYDMVNILAKVHRTFRTEQAFLKNNCIEEFNAEDFMQLRFEPVMKHLPIFFSYLRNKVTKEEKRIIESVLRSSTKLYVPLMEQQGMMTIVHTDPNPSNFLLGIDDHTSSWLIDWQSWRPGCGVQDICSLLCNFLPENSRSNWEAELLMLY